MFSCKISWSLPAFDHLKLNVDGSWKEQNEAVEGGVFRGVSGNWYMGFSSKFHAITPLATELYDYDIQNLELETNA